MGKQYEIKLCGFVTCHQEFQPEIHNAKYCSKECRRQATNRKVLDRYYERKEKRNTKRICEIRGCKTILSRYNEEDICEACKRERLIQRLVGWGWDEDRLRKDYEY